MLTGLVIILAAGVGGLVAGFVLWRAAHWGGLWNLFAGILLGLVAFALAILIGLVVVWSRGPR